MFGENKTRCEENVRGMQVNVTLTKKGIKVGGGANLEGAHTGIVAIRELTN